MLLELLGMATALGSKQAKICLTYYKAFSMYPIFDRHIPSISSFVKLYSKL
jgi:hypothetical protein